MMSSDFWLKVQNSNSTDPTHTNEKQVQVSCVFAYYFLQFDKNDTSIVNSQ